MSTRTGFLLHPDAALHDTGWGHPEHQGRLRTLVSAVEKALPVLHDAVEQVAPRAATPAELERAHPREYVERVRRACRRAAEEGSQVALDADTVVSGASWEAVTGSVGALLEAVERVADGGLGNAFAATRPPGHHAGPSRAMGFCLFNQVAVAVRHLQATGRARRVAVVDWDVHHGNGTQEIFEEDGDVYFLSLHQSPLFPGTGAAEERGRGAGAGTVRNVPLAAGVRGREYLDRFREALAAAAGEFTPEFVIVSAGFDALADDPLGGLLLDPADFHALTLEVLGWASEACEGRVALALEGGYDPAGTGRAVVACLRALAGLEAPPGLPPS